MGKLELYTSNIWVSIK